MVFEQNIIRQQSSCIKFCIISLCTKTKLQRKNCLRHIRTTAETFSTVLLRPRNPTGNESLIAKPLFQCALTHIVNRIRQVELQVLKNTPVVQTGRLYNTVDASQNNRRVTMKFEVKFSFSEISGERGRTHPSPPIKNTPPFHRVVILNRCRLSSRVRAQPSTAIAEKVPRSPRTLQIKRGRKISSRKPSELRCVYNTHTHTHVPLIMVEVFAVSFETVLFVPGEGGQGNAETTTARWVTRVAQG